MPTAWARLGSAGRRRVLGSAMSLASVGALAAAMVPLRTHVSVATTGLVLVVPVVAGAAIGGFVAGAVATVAGFLAYDVLFIPPYGTLTVGASQNWVALGVYVVVTAAVARVVGRLDDARVDATERATEAQRLAELSELLVEGRSVAEVLEAIVTAACQVSGDVRGVALLLPGEGDLEVVASAGEAPPEEALQRLSPEARLPVAVGTASAGGRDATRTVALSASGRPLGLLLLNGTPQAPGEMVLLRTFANHAALALERVQLEEQARRAGVLEEADRVRRALVGAVSHDLRTPLATIKVAATNLLGDGDTLLTTGASADGDGAAARLSAEERRELLQLVDLQADRLDRLVANLLDMTRIQAGVLHARLQPVTMAELVDEAVASLGAAAPDGRVEVRLPEELPALMADPVLVRQVLVNLLENALRHGPEEYPVTVDAAGAPGGGVVVTVSDRGPGVPAGEEESVFEMFNRRDAGGRAGLGLTIAKSFVEAHGGRIWLDAPRSRASFAFWLPEGQPPVPAE